MSTFQAISKRHERSPREAEIERVCDVLKAAIKSSEKSLSTERREADRALAAPSRLSRRRPRADDDASYDLGPRWGDAESAKALTPSAFSWKKMRANASERSSSRRRGSWRKSRKTVPARVLAGVGEDGADSSRHHVFARTGVASQRDERVKTLLHLGLRSLSQTLSVAPSYRSDRAWRASTPTLTRAFQSRAHDN